MIFSKKIFICRVSLIQLFIMIKNLILIFCTLIAAKYALGQSNSAILTLKGDYKSAVESFENEIKSGDFIQSEHISKGTINESIKFLKREDHKSAALLMLRIWYSDCAYVFENEDFCLKFKEASIKYRDSSYNNDCYDQIYYFYKNAYPILKSDFYFDKKYPIYFFSFFYYAKEFSDSKIYDRAEKIIREEREFSKGLRNDYIDLYVFRDISDYCEENNRADLSEKYSDSCIAICRNSKDISDSLKAVMYTHRANLYHLLFTPKSLPYLDTALNYAVSAADAKLCVDIGHTILMTLNWIEAPVSQSEVYAKLIKRYIDICPRNHENGMTFYYYYDYMNTYYVNNNNYETALAYMDSAMHYYYLPKENISDLYLNAKKATKFIYALSFYDSFDKKAEADSLIDNILKDTLKLSDEEKVICYDYIASHYMNTGEYEKALGFYKYCCDNYTENTNNYLFDYVLETADCYKACGKYIDADKTYREALTLSKEIYDETDIETASLYSSSGFCLTKLKKYDLAQKAYIKSNKISAEYSRFGFLKLSGEDFYNFWNYYQDVLQSSMAAIDQIPDPSPEFLKSVFNSVLLYKNMLFNSTTSLRRAMEQTPGGEALYDEIVDLRRKSLCYETETDYQRDSLYLRALNLEKQFLSSQEAAGCYNDLIGFDFEKIKSLLNKNNIAVEFCNLDTDSASQPYYAVVVSPKNPVPVFIKLFDLLQLDSISFDDENSVAEALVSDNSGVVNDFYNSDLPYNLIWKKIFNRFENVDTVYFSLSGVLNSTAPEFFKIPGNNKTVSDIYNTVRLSSLTRIVNKENFTFSNALIFGGFDFDIDTTRMKQYSAKYSLLSDKDYCMRIKVNADLKAYVNLPASFEEAREIFNISRGFGKQAVLCTGDSAVEELIKRMLDKKFDIIHIATHGFNITESENDYRDWSTVLTRTGLAFSGANNILKNMNPSVNVDDGILTSKEISQMNLSEVKLAVLSSCESGLGYTDVNGVFGLQRGLAIAGVKNVVVSLRSVSDEATSLMMRRFYGYLFAGDSPRTALKKASDYLRNGNRFNQPYYWTSFVLTE